jgi:DNA (cytosine-5)-methyltransferase 1
MSIKIGTVFSGIGAIEQALKRLKLEHEILFACDNGNIEVSIDYDRELKYIKTLKSVEHKKEYANGFYKLSTRKTNFVEISYLENYEIENNNFFYDIKLLDGKDFEKKIDLYVGGSPCQSFSVIGLRAGLDDTRGTLFYDYVRVLKEVQPKVFIFENVYGLFRHDKGKTWTVIKEVFESLGYSYKFQVLDSRDYGVPHGRRRVFVVGFKDLNKFKNFEFPKKKELKFTMQDFLIDNVKFGDFTSDKDGNINLLSKVGELVEDRYYLSEKLLKYCLSPGTKNFMHKDAKIDLPIARALLSTMGNNHRSSVNNYVTTDGKVRSLTIREAHRLMGFPDEYKIVVSKAQAYKQAGNSIVVDVLMEIMKEIYKAMGWDNGKNNF